MADTIILEYESVINAANRFQQLAEEVLDEARQMNSLRDGMNDAWKGESASKADEIYLEWGAVHKTIGDSLAQIAQKMRTTAEAIKNADETAAANM